MAMRTEYEATWGRCQRASALCPACGSGCRAEAGRCTWTAAWSGKLPGSMRLASIALRREVKGRAVGAGLSDQHALSLVQLVPVWAACLRFQSSAMMPSVRGASPGTPRNRPPHHLRCSARLCASTQHTRAEAGTLRSLPRRSRKAPWIRQTPWPWRLWTCFWPSSERRLATWASGSWLRAASTYAAASSPGCVPSRTAMAWGHAAAGCRHGVVRLW